jgi:catechol-2,3-dioxygenase
MKASPIGFQSVKVIALAATDLVRARQFYSETLGLEEDTTSTDQTGYHLGEQVLIFRDGYPPSDDRIRALLCESKTLKKSSNS